MLGVDEGILQVIGSIDIEVILENLYIVFKEKSDHT